LITDIEKAVLIPKSIQKARVKTYLSGNFTLVEVGVGFGVSYDTRPSVKTGKR
jgi:hypothetical protein